MEGHPTIYNIKKSVKIKADNPLGYEWFCQRAQKRGKKIRYVKNFLTIYDKFCLTLFKTKTGLIHINVTKIKTLKQANSVEEWLRCKYLRNDCSVVYSRIDNYFAKHNLNKPIDLSALRIHKNCTTHYNQERFPASFFKNSNGSACIFASGIVTLMGARSLKSLTQLWTAVRNVYGG